MIISIRFNNFYSLADEVVLDFTADFSRRDSKTRLEENLIDFNNDKFINILGLFGANAAGKSNLIKSMDFCCNLILSSHLYNEGNTFDFEPFKFTSEQPSEFFINFVCENIEYEYSFSVFNNKILSESLYYYPNRRRAKVFERTENNKYTYGKGVVSKPSEIETSTGANTLFLSRASSMNRPIMRTVYRFFAENIWIGFGNLNLSQIKKEDIESNKEILLKALEISDSDIVDIKVQDSNTNQFQLYTFHKENPTIPFDFEKEESEGTKRLFYILILIIKYIRRGTAFFLDEFDIKMHLLLAEFLLDAVRASKKSQLVFTSHNQSLINQNKLRHEQIVFVTKDSDGKSDFTPLSEFIGIDKKTDIQKAYLLGRFDGIPYTGDIYGVLAEMM